MSGSCRYKKRIAEPIPTRTGLIGWAQNQAEEVVNIRAETICGIRTEIPKGLTSAPQGTEVGKVVAQIANELVWVPFSDTVVVVLTCSSATPPDERAKRLLFFLHF